MKYFMECMTSKYASTKGRARRSEYWYFVLFNVIIQWVLQITIGSALAMTSGATSESVAMAQNANLLIMLPFLLPSLAVSVRRLHDIGKSGWWLLISFIPLLGGLILLIFACTDSNPGDNQYGPNPKA